MMHSLLSAAEAPVDPIWLRTLATVLPVVGTILVAILTGPKIIGRWKERKAAKARGEDPNEDSIDVHTQIAQVATAEAITNPILKLFIDDLHARLSRAHEDAAVLHAQRATDSAEIAQLRTELAEAEEKLEVLERHAQEHTMRTRALKRRCEELKQQVEATQRRLQICVEGYGQDT